jgi:hypothetical protein
MTVRKTPYSDYEWASLERAAREAEAELRRRRARRNPDPAASALTCPPPVAGDLCLTVRQPWASLILLGHKRVENRSWPTAHRGRLLAHAAARPEPVGLWPDLALDLVPVRDLPVGVILGSVEVYDCRALADLPADFALDPLAAGPYCWLLRNPRPLAVPVRRKGALSLWRF